MGIPEKVGALGRAFGCVAMPRDAHIDFCAFLSECVVQVNTRRMGSADSGDNSVRGRGGEGERGNEHCASKSRKEI